MTKTEPSRRVKKPAPRDPLQRERPVGKLTVAYGSLQLDHGA